MLVYLRVRSLRYRMLVSLRGTYGLQAVLGRERFAIMRHRMLLFFYSGVWFISCVSVSYCVYATSIGNGDRSGDKAYFFFTLPGCRAKGCSPNERQAYCCIFPCSLFSSMHAGDFFV